MPWLTVRFFNTTGQLVEQGKYLISVDPYELPAPYEPAVVSSGVYDNSIEMMDLGVDARDELIEAGALSPLDTSVNIWVVVAVADDLTARGITYTNVSLSQPNTIDLFADETYWDLQGQSAEQLLVLGPVEDGTSNVISPPDVPDSGESVPDSGGGGTTKEKERYVKIMQQHVGLGLDGSYAFTQGRETETGVAVSICGTSCTPWKIEGSMVERTSRSSQAGDLLQKGNIHRRVDARYHLKRRKRCVSIEPYSPWACTKWRWWWSTEYWTGEMKHAGDIDQPAKNDAYDLLLGNGGTFEANSQKNRKFSASFSLVGLSVWSQTGYRSNTSLYWAKIRNKCTHNYLYGDGAAVTQAPTIYSKSIGCS